MRSLKNLLLRIAIYIFLESLTGPCVQAFEFLEQNFEASEGYNKAVITSRCINESIKTSLEIEEKPKYSYHILIAEDNCVGRKILEKFLKNPLYRLNLTFAENGEKALEKFKCGNFDLLITDIDMPIMKGDELIKKILKIAPNFPIMVYSTEIGDFGIPENRVFSKKPFDIKSGTFIKMIQDILSEITLLPLLMKLPLLPPTIDLKNKLRILF